MGSLHGTLGTIGERSSVDYFYILGFGCKNLEKGINTPLKTK